MLEDISQHLLDVAENSITAGAQQIKITVVYHLKASLLELCIEDDGCGMSEITVQKLTDPFYTSRTTRRVGMGVPFLLQAAQLSGGELKILSRLGEGTRISVTFDTENIDCPPLGDLSKTITTLLMRSPEINWQYLHSTPLGSFSFCSEELDDVLDSREQLLIPEIALYIEDMIRQGIAEITP